VVWITDVCVPLSAFADALAAARRDLDASGLLAPIVGHAGDGNFHVFILMEDGNAAHLAAAEALNAAMVARAQAVGGTCTGEHGVGTGKRGFLERELGAGALAAMAAVKRALDPRCVLNPGKVLPDAWLPPAARAGLGHDHDGPARDEAGPPWRGPGAAVVAGCCAARA
jgi:D-lactate dehydrogenase (cytochrome)